MNTMFRKTFRCALISGNLILLLFCGLPLGNFLGGVFGLKIAGAVSGAPLESGTIPRALVFGGMILGILITTGSFLFLAVLARKVFPLENAATLER